MKLLQSFLLVLIVCLSFQLEAQTSVQSNWLRLPFSKKVSLRFATIKIDNKPATYSELLQIPDSSILKVEVFSKKAAQKFVDKDEAINGLVLVTLHKKHFPNPPAKKDSAIYIVENGDTIYCKHAQPAMLGDTTNIQWVHFLERSLKSQVPANNGAPAGLYNVDIIFLVNKEGAVSNVEVLEDPGYGTAGEVKRLMSKSPVWTPAMCNDIKVIYRQKERISFFVSEE